MTQILDAEDATSYASDLADTFERLSIDLHNGDYADAQSIVAQYGDVLGDVRDLLAAVERIAHLSDPASQYDEDPRV